MVAVPVLDTSNIAPVSPSFSWLPRQRCTGESPRCSPSIVSAGGSVVVCQVVGHAVHAGTADGLKVRTHLSDSAWAIFYFQIKALGTRLDIGSVQGLTETFGNGTV
jgi:hypothetical protein